ncbi:MAG: hypothetical protein ONB44_02945 [candidate division KSB1 bacterium]|nr:hypothetical protein [candidate division KSB1 bacterium]MDZ7301083.1 hypothetical protein [candidate division KSB1 bacterium]MDZ7312093.1 hypothetical protein [candidate division KSB1 bacterium]
MFDERLLPFIANISPTIMWIALTVGLLMFVIGYFAGGKLTLGRITMCVIIVTIVSVLALPAPIKLYTLVERGIDIRTTFVSVAQEDTTKSVASTTSTNQSGPKAMSTVKTKEGKVVVEQEVPFSLQLFTFILYVFWTAFLIGMGIFLYETLTVTAQEAERR